MDYVNLGSTGLKVSRLALGMMSYGSPAWKLAPWTLPASEGMPFVKRALELGINFLDTADVYSNGLSEELTGCAVREFARRDEVVIATKVFFGVHLDDGAKPNQLGLSRKHILHEVDASLRRLGTDYIDLLYIHRWDAETPAEETMEALNDVVRAGKVLYLGASSMYAWQFAKAQAIAAARGWTRFVAMQNHYNLVYREEEREMIPLCRDQGVALIPWSPLARGFLCGNRTPAKGGETNRAKTDTWAHDAYYLESDFEVVRAVQAVAEELGVSAAQVAMAWVLNKPFVTTALVGATKMHHLEEAVAAASIKLAPDQIARLEAHYQPHAVAGPM
jgi:aryl-alcohol dehydrogenase-like predicted oxidoreductase